MQLSLERVYEVSRLRLQIVSDIHLELRSGNPPPIITSAEILALCGDIGYPQTEDYKQFLEWSSKHYELVLVIAGNHEYWSKKIALQDMNEMIRGICKTFPNVVFLNNDWCILKSGEHQVRVIGSVLWTNLTEHPQMKYLINDYKKITTRCEKPGEPRKRSPITTINTTVIHLKSVAFLEEMLKENIPTVVLTHHLPSFQCAKHRDEYTPAYATNLERLIVPPVILWACGHSHSSIDIKINGIRVVSNQLGYPIEEGQTGYKKLFVINLQELIVSEL